MDSFLQAIEKQMKNLKKSYDSEGLLNDSKYMISITWNAPVETFAKPSNFFNQHSVNYVMMGTHKAFTFQDISKMPSFQYQDIIKNPNIQEDLKRLSNHLLNHIAK